MKPFRTLLILAAAGLPLGAQTATDVGLMMDGGLLTVIYGQTCGAFTCTPFTAGPVGAGNPHRVYVYGALNQPHVLAIDLANTLPCLPLPGFANALVLQQQPVTLALGVNAPWFSTTACPVGRGTHTLQFPIGTPPGIAFDLQALTISGSGLPAFTVAIRSTTA